MKAMKWIVLIVAAVLFVAAERSLALHSGGGTGGSGTGSNLPTN
jgi:hypothetical protein